MPGLPSDFDQSLKSQTGLHVRQVLVVRRQLDAHADTHAWPAEDRADVAGMLGLH